MPVYKYYTKTGKKYYLKLSISGKQIIKRGFNTEKEALIYQAAILKNQIQLNKYYVEDLIPTFLKNMSNKVKITTAFCKENYYKNYIFPFFKRIKIKDIKETHISLFAKKTNSKKDFQNKKRIFSLTNEFLDYLIPYGLDSNLNRSELFVPYDSLALHTATYDYYTREEFISFFNVIDNPKYKLIFLLLFNYGLRISEVLGLRHMDFTNNKVYIRGAIASKTGVGHQVYVSTKTKSSVRDYPMLNSIKKAYIEYAKTIEQFKRSDFIFKGQKNALTMGEHPIKAAQKKYEKLSGLRHIKIHEFRHSCATELINNGFSPEQVASWLGHSSSAVTLKTYFHLFPSRKLEIANYYDEKDKLK